MQFTRTLPKSLVHRAAIAEVFLTDAERRGEDEVVLAGQLPRLHAFYDDTLGLRTDHAPMLLLEACRQGIFVVAHRYFDVPADHRFLLRTVEFEVRDATALIPGSIPTELVIVARIERRMKGRSGLTGLRLRFTTTIGGREAMSACIAYSWMPPDAWESVRTEQRTRLGLSETPLALPVPRIEPALVDRRDPANAVISVSCPTGDGGRAALLVPDTGHPVMFDHWVDHVPGMLELEALRQLALTAAVDAGTLTTPAAQTVRLSARFRRFGEMDLPLECRTSPAPPGADIPCTLHQSGHLVAEARIGFADRAPAPTHRAEEHPAVLSAAAGVAAGAPNPART
ncbi:ScbA/BarX family gamma-butyrolactone biosynthesis protein [Streptomyces sp. NPDC047108]|uniref:ScbA/BarX family gamma-butyrolactone biosynthesis protein n=1 Tax=Streptomyces sp. NPDC047108 TaxID=3155025 RepID=UPI0033DFDFDF